MRLLESLAIPHDGRDGQIQLLLGDLSAITPEHEVDALAVSAFRGNYDPLPGTVIGALAERGLAVDRLADDKEVDLRDVSACWLSRPIERPDLHFRHLLCIEPASDDKLATEAVSDVFRSLIPYVTGEPWIRRIALPLLAAGKQGNDPLAMLGAILEAAIQWFSNGLPIDVMKIVIYDREPSALVVAASDLFRSYVSRVNHVATKAMRSSEVRYDVFVSYSHRDGDAVDAFAEQVRAINPEMRLFIDRSELDVGHPWQQSIFDAMDASRRIVCFYSPDYLRSDVCREEYHIALLRNREQVGVLVPAYLRTTRLPSYMRLVQYVDVRENDRDRLRQLAHRLTGEAVADRDAVASHTARSSDSVQTDEPPDVTELLEQVLDRLAIKRLGLQLDIRVRQIDRETG